MAADTPQVLRVLRHRGIAVRVSGGRLVARAVNGHADELVCIDGQWRRQAPDPGPVPDDMVAFIQHFRDDIVAYLTRPTEEEGLSPIEGAA